MAENATNEANISRKTQRQKDAARNRRIVLERLLGDAPGRKFVWDMIADAHVFSQTVAFGVEGHGVMCFAEGQRSAGLKLFNEILTHHPQSYILMTRENAAVALEDEEEENGGPST